MSLWTPYADAPLDLTKTVKLETESCPELEPAPGGFVPYVAGPAAELLPAPYYACPYYGVPSAQLSPLSVTSAASYEPAPPSPPTSPAAAPRRCSAGAGYMVDADAMSDDPDFQAFERDALRAMAERNGGSLLGDNPRMRRAVKSTCRDAGDDSYRKQRERNNFAAKQSRDRRKLREIHLALKVAYLKNEVAALRGRLAANTCGTCRPALHNY